jgi:hypothetical protein
MEETIGALVGVQAVRSMSEVLCRVPDSIGSSPLLATGRSFIAGEQRIMA